MSDIIIDRKYVIRDGQIVNAATGQALAVGEPRILFRAQDALARPMLYYYIELAKEAGADVHFIREMQEIAEDFEEYRRLATTKVPD